jgi:hypothetical protein
VWPVAVALAPREPLQLGRSRDHLDRLVLNQGGYIRFDNVFVGSKPVKDFRTRAVLEAQRGGLSNRSIRRRRLTFSNDLLR